MLPSTWDVYVFCCSSIGVLVGKIGKLSVCGVLKVIFRSSHLKRCISIGFCRPDFTSHFNISSSPPVYACHSWISIFFDFLSAWLFVVLNFFFWELDLTDSLSSNQGNLYFLLYSGDSGLLELALSFESLQRDSSLWDGVWCFSFRSLRSGVFSKLNQVCRLVAFPLVHPASFSHLWKDNGIYESWPHLEICWLVLLEKKHFLFFVRLASAFALAVGDLGIFVVFFFVCLGFCPCSFVAVVVVYHDSAYETIFCLFSLHLCWHFCLSSFHLSSIYLTYLIHHLTTFFPDLYRKPLCV